VFVGTSNSIAFFGQLPKKSLHLAKQ